MGRAGARGTVMLLLVLGAGAAYAQRGGGEFMNIPPRFAPDPMPDRNFAVCRIMYDSVRREPAGGGWLCAER